MFFLHYPDKNISDRNTKYYLYLVCMFCFTVHMILTITAPVRAGRRVRHSQERGWNHVGRTVLRLPADATAALLIFLLPAPRHGDEGTDRTCFSVLDCRYV